MGDPIQTFSREEFPFVKQVVQVKTINIDSTAVDAGHTGNTHILRAGLMLAHTAAVSGFTDYRTGAAAGEGDIADCILMYQVDLKDGDAGAASTDHKAVVMWIGEAVSDHCLLYDAAALADLAKGGGGEGTIEFATA